MPGILPTEQILPALQGGQQPGAAAGPATPQQQTVSMTLPSNLAEALTTGRLAGLSAAEQAQVNRIRQQYGSALRYFDAGTRSETPFSTYLFQVMPQR